MSMKDAFDIGIVALMVYQVLKIVHGTRAVQMIFGLFFLAVLYAIGVSYSLYTLNWILDHFFDYFFIIFIILFQDQLRSALANFGIRRSVFSFFDRSGVITDIEEIINSTSKLSSQRTGALIVLERENGLENYVETGTRLSSELHSELLQTIFLPKSPLHDGAVIIRENKILAAGCFLPLSKNVEVDRNFGTRHRAAIGVSEVSDAAVIVVSEETGAINFCLDGTLYRCESDNHLRRYLKNLWTDKRLKNKDG